LPRKALTLLSPVGVTKKGQKLVTEIRTNVRKRSSSAPMYAAKEDVRNLIDKTVERFGRLDGSL